MEIPRLVVDQDHFPHTPVGSPAKILKTLDLLGINGRFMGADTSRGSSVLHSPINQNLRAYKQIDRRSSFTSDEVYDHTISDEFAEVHISIKERRQSTSLINDNFYENEFDSSNYLGRSPKKHTIFSKAVENSIILAKPFSTATEIPKLKTFLEFQFNDDEDEDEIEIVDLDAEDDFQSTFSQFPREDCYPNCDVNVWLRSRKNEIVEPMEGELSGSIPSWINGSLLRNGPGSIELGNIKFNHLFDSAALLHRFNIKDGNATYQCRFLQSNSYKQNVAADRVVISEFGTACVPDPCQSIFQRVSAVFKQPADANSDNAMISIYPFGDEYFAFTETPVVHKIDEATLDTMERLDLHDKIGIINHTSHPHVMADGSVYNLGMTVTKAGPCYNIIHFPLGEKMFDNAKIVCSIPTRWKLHPGYMHTFGITDSYFIIVEQPLTVSVAATIKCKIKNEPLIGSLKWFPEQPTYIYLIDRDTNSLRHTFQTESFFYLHIINQYEKDDHVIIDICCYRDPEMLNCMYIETMKGMQKNPDYARMFRGRPLRFVLPLTYPSERYSPFNSFFSKSNRFDIDQKVGFEVNSGNLNLVKLTSTNASAYMLPNGQVYCKPELLCDLGCETPRIYYEKFVGLEYQYFYAISADVDSENPGTIIKVDTQTKKPLTWCETNCYPSEPIFVPSPNPESEDDGVLLSAAVWGREEENKVGLLVLCAKTMTELGRCVFTTDGPVPKCLHGWFHENKN